MIVKPRNPITSTVDNPSAVQPVPPAQAWPWMGTNESELPPLKVIPKHVLDAELNTASQSPSNESVGTQLSTLSENVSQTPSKPVVELARLPIFEPLEKFLVPRKVIQLPPLTAKDAGNVLSVNTEQSPSLPPITGSGTITPPPTFQYVITVSDPDGFEPFNVGVISSNRPIPEVREKIYTLISRQFEHTKYADINSDEDILTLNFEDFSGGKDGLVLSAEVALYNPDVQDSELMYVYNVHRFEEGVLRVLENVTFN